MKMKKFLLMSSFGALLFTACESSSEVKEADVPQSVKSAFTAKYPSALSATIKVLNEGIKKDVLAPALDAMFETSL